MEYCGQELNEVGKQYSAKVCNGRDFYSSIAYKKLIADNKHLPFFEPTQKKNYFTDPEMGILIRWLYRGMTLKLAIWKVREQKVVANNCARGRS